MCFIITILMLYLRSKNAKMNWISFDLDQESLYESCFAGDFNLL